MINQKILKVLESVRTLMDSFASSKESKNYDFHSKEDLQCACCITSKVLFDILKEQGKSPKLCIGIFFDGYTIGLKTKGKSPSELKPYVNHCWIELDGKILDLTATQFNEPSIKHEFVFPKIHITYKSDKKYLKVYDNSLKGFKTEISQWPRSQKPNVRLLKKLKELYYSNYVTET